MLEIRLHQFLDMPQHEQRATISRIKEYAKETPLELWNDGESATPEKPGYYAVIAGYRNRKASHSLTVARWSGTEWRDCYDNSKSVSGRYTALDIIKWIA